MQLLYKTVKSVLDSGRVGSPVFVRCVAQIASDREHLTDALAEMLAIAGLWLGASPQKVYVQGCGADYRNRTLSDRTDCAGECERSESQWDASC